MNGSCRPHAMPGLSLASPATTNAFMLNTNAEHISLRRYLWRRNYNLSITQVYSQINDPIVQSSNLQQLSYDINGPYADPDDFVDYLTTCEGLTTPLPSP